MFRFILSIGMFAILASFPCLAGGSKIELKSPDGKITATISMADGHLNYAVKFHGQTVVETSALGITIDGQDLGQGAAFAGKAVTRKINEIYPMFGNHALATNNCLATFIPLTSGGTAWSLEVRIFDDGFSYRYRIPGDGTRHVDGECSEWKIPVGTTVWSQSASNTSYEARYEPAIVGQQPKNLQIMAPATLKFEDGMGYAMMTEANLVNYSDMSLRVDGSVFKAFFHNSRGGWDTTGEIVSPWRVTMLAANLNDLVNSDLIKNLCPPPAPELAQASWIRPGRSTWGWLSCYCAPKLDVQKEWIDRTKALGFEYYLIDDGWRDWNGGGDNAWKAMAELVKYAKAQGVEIWVWVHCKYVHKPEDRLAYFQRAKSIGIVGLKIDFMEPANTEWVNWYDETLRVAASLQLMIDFHGAVKPSGRERTWPNEMTREAIAGREQGKSPATHDTALPFLRYVQGHADFTPTLFMTNRLSGSSFAHELAMAVVFTSPFLCLGDNPKNYLNSDAADVIKALPPVWDETIVLPGSEIGGQAAFARRHGDEWFVGVINGQTPRRENIPLKFLGKGKFKLVELADSSDRNDAFVRSERMVTAKDSLMLPLREDGGYVAWLKADRSAALQPHRSEGVKITPPAAPLVACDPYFSIWSPADKLTDADTTHWTGKPHRIASLVRIDGKTFRLMGTDPVDVPALPQSSLEVLPTRTIYTFDGAGIRLTLAFMTADLPDDLDVLARPVTYLTWAAQSTDNRNHKVSVYFDARSEIAVNTPEQAVNFEGADVLGINAWRVGTVDQPVLKKRGDDLRIDWGYFYVAMTKDQRASSTVGVAQAVRDSFMANGGLAGSAAEASLTNNARNDSVIAFAVDLGVVQTKPVSRWLMLAYDDLYSIQYMKKNLRPYWRRNGWEAADLLSAAAQDYASLQKRCAAFDIELMGDLRNAGGENYAALGALAYRQCFAAGKFVADDNGQPLQFCKENHSNGCISTSDVFYPMAPQFLLFSPTLAKSFIVPFMNYAASERWRFPFAPHDLGTYPQANGQVYGDGERGVNNQMPVEECGNLLCLFGAVAAMEGNADFAGLYWKQLEQWAGYLKAKGFDPEKQLCTDDFAGHLAHNVNLSAKAICALGSFAKLCELRGDKVQAAEYSKLARELAQRWVKEADDGDHFRMAFDRPGTWSQKYNLVWDNILGLNLFPAEVVQKEVAFYKKMQNQYGLPLDNRETYTKLDWITWTATLTQNRADFEALVNPVAAFLKATPDRSPMTDWYQTKTARKVGFTGRPVVGGVFLQMLYDKTVWQKYAARDKTKASNWACIPAAPKVTVILPAADTRPAVWRYTMARPDADWMNPHFNDSSWQQGKSGFGTAGTPGAVVGTTWQTEDIWLRREVDWPSVDHASLQAWFHHDEDAEVYINGVLAIKAGGFTTGYDFFPLTSEGRVALKPGKNVIAIHCHQTFGGQYVDFGLSDIQSN